MQTACTEAAGWPSHVRLAVNVSPVQLKSPDAGAADRGRARRFGPAADRLEIEITEAVLIHDDETALAILHQLRAIGVRIALDDFGTGFSSLSYLKRFPFDKIKIDRCFVSDIEDDGSAAIVQAVVNIAAARNMTTTAEGVETEQQRDIAAPARLHPDAGLSVQRAEAGFPSTHDARYCLRQDAGFSLKADSLTRFLHANRIHFA